MGLLKPLQGLLPQARNFMGDSQRWHQAPDPPAVAGASEESCCLLGPRSGSRPGPHPSTRGSRGPACRFHRWRPLSPQDRALRSGPFRSTRRLRKDECARERM